mgnify:CR=1 FL=1
MQYAKFAEKLNGRCAMQGVVWGTIRGAMTHKGIIEQVVTQNTFGGYDISPDSILCATSVIALVTLGTSASSFIENKDLIESSTSKAPKNFTEDTELLNGRLAMLGFVLLVMITR